MNELQALAMKRFENRDSFFLTGAGGTGKSFIISKIVERADEMNVRLGLTAMTGAAALLIGGKTVHSLLGLGLGEDEVDVIVKKIRTKQVTRKRWQLLDCLVIDEISMMSPTLLEKIEQIARKVRKNQQVMGGLQVIFSGDFFQLPPVEKTKKISASSEQTCKFCFGSKMWNEIVPDTVELVEVFRQTDPHFQKVLSRVRMGICDDDVEQALRSRLIDQTSEKIPLLSRTSGGTDDSDSSESESRIVPTKLYTKNRDVDMMNATELLKLQRKVKRYPAQDCFEIMTKSDDALNADRLNTPEQEYDREKIGLTQLLDKNSQCPRDLSLCVGAQVMLLKNLDFDRGLVNGSRGVVIGFDMMQRPEVEFRDGSVVSIEKNLWKATNDDVGIAINRYQYPLRLAWSITIHKCEYDKFLFCASSIVLKAYFGY